MNKLHLLLANAALVALVAGPATALSVGANLGGGVSSGNSGVSVGLSGQSSAAADGLAMADASSGIAPGGMGRTFLQNLVISADGSTIGTVTNTMAGPSGTVMLIVTLDSAIDSKVDSFSIKVAANASASGEILLGMTQAELMSALDAQVQG